MPYSKTCKFCGDSFISKESKTKFCSKQCYWKYKIGTSLGKRLSAWKDAICPNCNIKFQYTVHSRGKNPIYCSMKCKLQHYITPHKKSVAKIELICEFCKKDFYVLPCYHFRRFCSVKCKNTNNIVLQNKNRNGFGSNFEKDIYNYIKLFNIKIEKQKRLGSFLVDFFINDKLVLECDGDYWHNKPDVIERDARKNKFIKESGLNLHRIKYSDYISDKHKVLNNLFHICHTLQ